MKHGLSPVFSPKFSRGGVLKSLANFHKFPQCRVGGGMGFTTKYYRGDRGMGWCVCVCMGGGGGGLLVKILKKCDLILYLQLECALLVDT